MPDFNIIKESTVPHTFRCDYIIGKFDLQLQDKVTEHFQGEIPLEEKQWKIGLIYGGSGTGKTTIAKELFPSEYTEQNWTHPTDKPIIDCFNQKQDMTTIIHTLNRVGLNTVWTYLKPYNALSNGEKMRVELADVLLNENKLTVFDEFTSVVDRTVAKTSCVAIAKTLQKEDIDKQIVLLSCHEDIIPYIQPDWIFDTNTYTFTWNDVKKNQNSTSVSTPSLTNTIKKYGECLVNTTT